MPFVPDGLKKSYPVTDRILGTTGSGKSTLVQMVLRFYEVTGGRILLNDRDLRELSQEALLRFME